MIATIDHLVVAAATLDQGVQWCEATLGVPPGPGGTHPLMGTHNRLLRMAHAAFPRVYFEIIAIDPAAAQPGRRRWFDLDDLALQHAVRKQPRLVNFVAATRQASLALEALRMLGIDGGSLIAAQRDTPPGLLRWQISVRADGQRLFQGGLPTLIEWGEVHPTDAMPDSGIVLESLTVHHPLAGERVMAQQAMGLQGVTVQSGPANLVATLVTPRGPVMLESKGA